MTVHIIGVQNGDVLFLVPGTGIQTQTAYTNK
jgi:hypothetical protein